jgi:putative membrane fusion protein
MVVGKRIGRQYLRLVDNRPAPRRLRWVWILLLLLLAAGGAGGAYLYVAAPAVQTVAAEQGEIHLGATVDAIVLREEVRLTSAAGGAFAPLVPSGKRVRSGSAIATVGGAEVRTDLPGNVVWEVDGLEGLLTPESLKAATPDWFHRLPQPQPQQLAEGATIAAGGPIGRLIIGADRLLVAALPANSLPAQWNPKNLQVAIPSLNWTGTGEGAQWRGEGAERLLILQGQELPEGIDGVRKVRLELTFAAYKGIIVPRTAVDVRGGKQGVWIVQGGKESFAPGAVVGGDGSSVAMKLSIDAGTLIRRQAPTHLD